MPPCCCHFHLVVMSSRTLHTIPAHFCSFIQLVWLHSCIVLLSDPPVCGVREWPQRPTVPFQSCQQPRPYRPAYHCHGSDGGGRTVNYGKCRKGNVAVQAVLNQSKTNSRLFCVGKVASSVQSSPPLLPPFFNFGFWSSINLRCSKVKLEKKHKKLDYVVVSHDLTKNKLC